MAMTLSLQASKRDLGLGITASKYLLNTKSKMYCIKYYQIVI